MKSLLFLMLISLGSFVHAVGFFIDPYLGAGKQSLEWQSSDLLDGSGTSLELGARAGLFWSSFFLGLEYGRASGSYSFDSPAGASDQDFTDSNLSFILGTTLGKENRFRIWGGYILSAGSELEASDGSKSEFSGSGFQLGAGYRMHRHVSINLTYRTLTFNEYTANGVTIPLPLFNAQEAKSNTIALSVSFPFGTSGK